MSVKKAKFKIGQWVEFKATTHSYYKRIDTVYNSSIGKNHIGTSSYKLVERKMLNKSRTGQIIGAKYRMEGISHHGTSDDSGGFDVKKTVLVWLVSEGFTNKPCEVLEEDITDKVLIECNKTLPWRKVNSYWTKKARRAMSKESRGFPRDSKGKFC